MIVGAGVIGCYLGKILGDQEIWELRDSLWEKPCGGLISKNIKKLDIDLSESLVNEVKGAKFFSNNESFEIKKNETQAYVVNKLKFQQGLVKDAKDAGCDIQYKRPWRGQPDDMVIGADGAVSEVAKSCGLKREYIQTYQIKCTLNEKVDPDFVHLYFGEFAKGFNGWLIPFDEKNVKIGVGCTEGNVKQYFEIFKKKFSIGQVHKEQSALIPVFDGEKSVFENKALVGDAAAQVKASTGGGIIFGCLCAEELKKAIDADDLEKYDEFWKKKYGNDLELHFKVRRFIDKQDHDKFFSMIKEKGLVQLIEEKGDMEHPKALIAEIIKRPDLWGMAFKVWKEL